MTERAAELQKPFCREKLLGRSVRCGKRLFSVLSAALGLGSLWMVVRGFEIDKEADFAQTEPGRPSQNKTPRASVPTLPDGSCHKPIAEFSLISQNAYLVLNHKPTDRGRRARWIGEEIGKKGFDIVLLQEVFAPAHADELRRGYGSRINVRFHAHQSGYLSGLMILSKFANAQESAWWSWLRGYENSGSVEKGQCANMDCLSRKGARWARLKVPAVEGDPGCMDNGNPCIYVNVMTVHLQSSYAYAFPEYGDGLDAKVYQDVRRRNLGAIKRFYKEYIQRYREPLVICGDWNMPLHAPWRQSHFDGSLDKFWNLGDGDELRTRGAQVDSFETEWHQPGPTAYSQAGTLPAIDLWKYYHRYADPGSSEVKDSLTYLTPQNGGSSWVPADAQENYRYDGCFVVQDSEKWQLAALPEDVWTEKLPASRKVCKSLLGCCDVVSCMPGPGFCCLPPTEKATSLSDHFGIAVNIKVYRKPSYAALVASRTRSIVEHTEPLRCGDGRCTQGERAVGDPNPQRAGFTECAADCGRVGNSAGTSWPLPYCGNGLLERVVQYDFRPEYSYRIDESAETCARDSLKLEPVQAPRAEHPPAARPVGP